MSPTSSTAADRIIRPIALDLLYSPSPTERLAATRTVGRLARRSLAKRAAGWPPDSPGAINAWLLLVTTKPPLWRDPLLRWVERPLTLGEPHEGFFYPDPLGFWTEIRRWATVLLQRVEPSWSTPEALSVTTLLHVGDDTARLIRALDLCRPRLLLFLDEPSWQASGVAVHDVRAFEIPDPHRAGQAYEGFWARGEGGATIGKSPQHPAAHKLYRAADLTRFLAAAPAPA